MARLVAALAILLVLPGAMANSLSGASVGIERNNVGAQVWDVYELQVGSSGWIDLDWRTGSQSTLHGTPVYHFQLYRKGAFDDNVLEAHEILSHGREAGAGHEELSIGLPAGAYPIAVIPRSSLAEGYTLHTEVGSLVLAGQLLVPLCPAQDPCQ